MAESIPAPVPARHHIYRETSRPRMATAKLPDLTLREKRAEYGRLLHRTRELAGMNRDQVAVALGVHDPSQISKWESGVETPQTCRYRAHPALRLAYLRAQLEADARTDGSTVVAFETVIRIKGA